MVRSFVRLNDELPPSLSSFLLLRFALLLHSAIHPTSNQDSALSESETLNRRFLLLPLSSFFFRDGRSFIASRIPIAQLEAGTEAVFNFFSPILSSQLAPIYSAPSFLPSETVVGVCPSRLTNRPLFCHFLNGRSSDFRDD